MSQERVDSANSFAAAKHPGMVGCEVLTAEAGEVTGRLVVREEVIAGTGFLWAPVVITLADWLCAVGTGETLAGSESSFTTLELKTNFLGSARAGETIFGRATARHLGRTTQVWDVEVENQSTGRTIALMRLTQMILVPRGRG